MKRRNICPLSGRLCLITGENAAQSLSAENKKSTVGTRYSATPGRKDLLLHPDFTKNVWHERERCWPCTSPLHQENNHTHVHRPCASTHRLKCSMIFSSRTFSGKFPTHKCLVSRTILCAPAALSYRWVCYVRSTPCKTEKGCKTDSGKDQKSSPQIIDWSRWPDVNHKAGYPHAVWYSSLFKRDLAPRERAPRTVPVTRRVPDTMRPLGVERKHVAS